MKKIGITGANGHVGANLIRRLATEDFDVRVLQYHGSEGFEGFDVEVVKGNLNDKDSLKKFCTALDVIIHLAAKISIGHNSYESLEIVNVDGTKNLVEEAKNAGVKRFIHFSTIDAFIHPPYDDQLDETSPLALDSEMAYEKTKSLAEEWIRKQQTASFDVIVLNPTAIVGPYDFKPSLIGDMIIRLYHGKVPALIPGGYDFVDIRDVCDAACSAIYQGKGGDKYILSGKWRSLADFAALLGSVSDKKINNKVIPMWVAWMGLPFITSFAKLSGQQPLYTRQMLTIIKSGSKNISNEKAKKELGFTARPLADTLKDTLNWFKENNFIKE